MTTQHRTSLLNRTSNPALDRTRPAGPSPAPEGCHLRRRRRLRESPAARPEPGSAEPGSAAPGVSANEPLPFPPRAWAPEKWRLRLSAASWAASFALWITLCARSPHISLAWYLPACVMFLIYLASVLEAVRRPRFLTADAGELSLAAWRSSCAVRWEEIQGLELQGETLRLSVPSSLFYSLAGYSQSARDEIVQVILNRSQLRPVPGVKGLYTRK